MDVRFIRRRDAGFSLVESLASLVVVGMLSLMLVSGVSAGHRVWERIDASEASGESVQSVQTLLRERLERVYPQTRFEGPAASIDFRGGRESVEFLAEPEEAGRPGVVRRYRLELATDGRLVLSSSDELGPPLAQQWVDRTLASGVRQIEIDYFGVSPPSGRRQWRSDWVGQPTPPELVRIRVAFRAGDRRAWPELIARPLTNVDTGCILDVNAHGCRGRV